MSPLALAVPGCADMRPRHAEGRVLSTTFEQRFTDEAIRRDWKAFDTLRARIDRARRGGASAYVVARAEAQLDFGVDEYEENDRTGVVEAALDDALRLITRSESGPLGTDDLSLPTFPGTTLLRPEAWGRLRAAKADESAMRCAGELIAKLEVALIEYGHEQYEADTGLNEPDHAQPHAALVDSLDERLTRALARASTDCPAPAAKPAVATAPSPAVLPETPLQLRAEALFRFDEHVPASMLPEGRAQLDALGAALARAPRAWSRIVITGHTDRLGGHAYNLTLSSRRALTVREYLARQHGLPLDRLVASGNGAALPLVFCHGSGDQRLRACLQPNRRVEIEVLR